MIDLFRYWKNNPVFDSSLLKSKITNLIGFVKPVRLMWTLFFDFPQMIFAK